MQQRPLCNKLRNNKAPLRPRGAAAQHRPLPLHQRASLTRPVPERLLLTFLRLSDGAGAGVAGRCQRYSQVIFTSSTSRRILNSQHYFDIIAMSEISSSLASSSHKNNQKNQRTFAHQAIFSTSARASNLHLVVCYLRILGASRTNGKDGTTTTQDL